MRCLLALGFVTFLAACASSPKNYKVMDDPNLQNRFDQGVRALDSERYEEAARIFDAMVTANPGTEMDLVAIYNSGVAYVAMGDCQKGTERFRQVVRSSASKFKRIEGEALFRLSLAYECLGQDAKTITALLDAKRRGKELNYETLNAELPARMAAAYARMGNHEKALEYFNQASRGLKSVVARSGSTKKEVDLIARTLFLMGKLSPNQKKANVDPTRYLQSVSMQQPYLLQAMELNRMPWSGKAEDDMKAAYQNIWTFTFESPEQQRQFYTRGIQTLNELRKIRMPSTDPGITSVFALIDQTETRLLNELGKMGEPTPLTPTAQKREGLRREGKLIEPKGKKSRSQ